MPACCACSGDAAVYELQYAAGSRNTPKTAAPTARSRACSGSGGGTSMSGAFPTPMAGSGRRRWPIFRKRSSSATATSAAPEPTACISPTIFPTAILALPIIISAISSEAQKELELSLSQAETGKAKYYLNEVRRALLKQAGTDAAPPAVSLESPEGGPGHQQLQDEDRGRGAKRCLCQQDSHQ